jgi:hypothetical protein
MAKQTINVGSATQAGDGEQLRSALIKVNQNFTEVYENLETIDQRTDTVWVDSENRVFNTINWNSGSQITVTATPYETVSVVTYDARTDSDTIWFVWDQNFIDTVWEGNNTEIGEGQAYEISFDNGVTWYSVETNEYSTNDFFNFVVPLEFRDSYTFTYTQGQTVLIKFNRGNNLEVWFDLANAPVSTEYIIGVDMSVTVEATIPGEPNRTATVIRPNYRFMNVLYDVDTGQGSINSGANIWSGSDFVEDKIQMSIRRSIDPTDAGRIYAKFNNGVVGTMTFYWNAKLYTITQEQEN